MALADFLIKLLLQGLYEKAVGTVSGIQLKIVKDQDTLECSYIFLAGPQKLSMANQLSSEFSNGIRNIKKSTPAVEKPEPRGDE